MALEQHGDSLIFSSSPDRKPASATAATGRPRRKDLAELAFGDATDAVRLARQLRGEWRRERYSRLLAD